ncbi:MAG: hypothetical protein HY815_25145 [Candidatus Riflebacteria bacterium]|nr:hypothetical protein [Candidatus Riflebacteria bacterium]
MLTALDFILGKPLEIVIAGSAQAPQVQAFLRTIHDRYLPNKVLAVVDNRAGDGALTLFPGAAGKGTLEGRPAVYVCRDRTCWLPITDPGELSAQLKGHQPAWTVS